MLTSDSASTLNECLLTCTILTVSLDAIADLEKGKVQAPRSGCRGLRRALSKQLFDDDGYRDVSCRIVNRVGMNEAEWA